MIRIYCENDGEYHNYGEGITLEEISEELCPYVTDEKTGMKIPVLAALVDHQLKELSFTAMVSHNVRFIGYDHPDGRRTYVRSLSFVLQNVIHELYPDKVLTIN